MTAFTYIIVIPCHQLLHSRLVLGLVPVALEIKSSQSVLAEFRLECCKLLFNLPTFLPLESFRLFLPLCLFCCFTLSLGLSLKLSGVICSSYRRCDFTGM
jgi:hypothetical protein